MGSAASARANAWQLPARRLEFASRPLLMGILNVTPDSFSDGGQFLSTAAAVEHGLRLAAEGADLLDIGGESTRPGAAPLDPRTELARVLPVIEALRPRLSIPLSIDTSQALVAREALAAGAEIVNDVRALGGDPRLKHVVRETQAAVVLMHMQGVPATMQERPHYEDVVAEVVAFLAARRDAIVAFGIAQARIALDPGIGFGKTAEHNWALLADCHRLHALGCPVLVGHSRKRFLSERFGDGPADRLAGALEVARWLAGQGVQMLRVHDVAAVRAALEQGAGQARGIVLKYWHGLEIATLTGLPD